jgi:hypothetical protein
MAKKKKAAKKPASKKKKPKAKVQSFQDLVLLRLEDIGQSLDRVAFATETLANIKDGDPEDMAGSTKDNDEFEDPASGD